MDERAQRVLMGSSDICIAYLLTSGIKAKDSLLEEIQSAGIEGTLIEKSINPNGEGYGFQFRSAESVIVADDQIWDGATVSRVLDHISEYRDLERVFVYVKPRLVFGDKLGGCDFLTAQEFRSQYPQTDKPEII